jgi:formate hydrogenlyase transcriptional activator
MPAAQKDNKVVGDYLPELFDPSVLSVHDRAGLILFFKQKIEKFIAIREILIISTDPKTNTGRIFIRVSANLQAGDFQQDIKLFTSHPGCKIFVDILKQTYQPFNWKPLGQACPLIFSDCFLDQKDTGAQLVAVPLINDANHILTAFISVNESKPLNSARLYALDKVAPNMSVLLSNILRYEREEQLAKEQYKLLSLGNGIVGINNKEDLLSVISQQLKPLIPFNDIIITVKNDDEKYQHTFAFDVAQKHHNNPEFELLIKSPYWVEDGIIDTIMQAVKPVKFMVSELLKHENVPGYIQYSHKSGVKEITGVAMKNRNREIGAIFFTAEATDSFSDEHIALIKGFASQLSIVISNIISNETIRRRENELSVLLEFSTEISSVRQRDRIQDVLKQTLLKLFPLAGFAVVLKNDERRSYSSFVSSFKGTVPAQFFTSSDSAESEISNKLFSRLANDPDPTIFDSSNFSGFDTASSSQKNDIENFFGIGMHCDQQLFGGLFVFSSIDATYLNKNKYLLCGLAEQLASAITNTLAYEMISKREHEKNVLLEINKELSKIRSRSDLRWLLDEQIKRLIPFDQIVIINISHDKKQLVVFAASKTLRKDAGEIYRDVVYELDNVTTSILDQVNVSGWPKILNFHEAYLEDGILRSLKSDFGEGSDDVIISPLYDSKEEHGFIIGFVKKSFQVQEEQLNLLFGISTQLSIVINNIIENELLEKRMSEISGSRQQLEFENLYLQQEILTQNNYSELIGTGKAMNYIFDLISKVSKSESSVLILGETGTGKELIARAIHNNSERSNKVMVKVNCATLPVNLIESELFGHERGSFTGATEKRIGKFELANNSTLFLDEIGELPLDLQAKILRALQEREIERIGGRAVIKINVRIIAATNRELQKEVAAGDFRSDLYFRLNIFPITIPPLRDRKDDIPLLAMHFLEKHNKKGNKKILGFSTGAMNDLINYKWPGNVRELEHMIERAILMTSQTTIKSLDLPLTKMDESQLNKQVPEFMTIEEVERQHLLLILKACNGKVGGPGGAASILKLPATTVHSKMKKLGITRKFGNK